MTRPAPAWCLRYVNKPHVMGARGPDAYDCWGLVVDVLERELGLRVPTLEGADLWEQHERLALWRSSVDEAFEPVEEAQLGDVLFFDVGGEHHVGVVVGSDWMLHTRSGQGSYLSRWRLQPWSTTHVATFRARGARRA